MFVITQNIMKRPVYVYAPDRFKLDHHWYRVITTMRRTNSSPVQTQHLSE